ncbi:MAG: DUF4239 domain-containing protein [Gallionella sp.]|jgi:hypothetical protein
MPLSAWLAILPEWISAPLVIGSFVLFGVATVLVVRHFIPHSLLKPHNDISGFVFATLGVIYGVMLAFVVVAILEQYNDAVQTAENESSSAYSLYRDLNLYPNREAAGQSLVALRAYTLSMVHDEYPNVKAMKWDAKYQPSLITHKTSAELWKKIGQIAPQNLHEQSIYTIILKDINSMMEYRVQRRLSARTDLPGVIWAVVILGGLIVVGFMSLFGHENIRVHLLITVLLAIVTSSVIYVIVCLNFPFVGSISIEPHGYEYLIELAGW